VLLGFLARSAPIPKPVWLEAIREVVPAKILDLNMKAFEAGYGLS
jgi:indolepyruvate ferredoxin oxidoreductase beta subunit